MEDKYSKGLYGSSSIRALRKQKIRGWNENRFLWGGKIRNRRKIGRGQDRKELIKGSLQRKSTCSTLLHLR